VYVGMATRVVIDGGRKYQVQVRRPMMGLQMVLEYVLGLPEHLPPLSVPGVAVAEGYHSLHSGKR
jgi:hypothetical protein